MVEANQADRRRDYRTTIRLCGQVLASNPTFYPAQLMSAVAFLKAGHRDAAERKFLAILQSTPDSFPACLWLGTMYSHARRNSEAIAISQRAVGLKPADKDARMLLGRLLFEESDLVGSERELRRALEVDVGIAEAHGILGTILQQFGHMEEAEIHLLRAIEIEPQTGPPYFDLAMGRKFNTADSPLLERFRANSNLQGIRPRDRSRIEFALGKAEDDLSEYEKAIVHYDEANRLALDVMHRSGIKFNPEQLAEDFRKGALASSFWNVALAGSYSEKPIFVVGMMRSGTTLVEQILSCHSQVAAAGEMNFWLSRISDIQSQERAPSQCEASQLSNEFLKELDRVGPDNARVIDKSPHNFIALGSLHAIFPNARFIHCRRRLIDSCLSLYMTPFRVPPQFGHSRENIVTFAKQYDQITRHWREVMPSDRYMEVSYEDLVANPEPVIRSMVSFIGLDWEDSCLHHERNRKAVRTPSLWQVRQPIYKGSLERWRRYEPWLGVFRELIP
jgi:tetratricopeptide (TPR) repeat protein